MNYLKFSLGHQDAGSMFRTTLSGVESDVFLVDTQNLANFADGRPFRYVGGHYKRSPVDLTVPSSGTWTLVVVPGLGGSVRAEVQPIIP